MTTPAAFSDLTVGSDTVEFYLAFDQHEDSDNVQDQDYYAARDRFEVKTKSYNRAKRMRQAGVTYQPHPDQYIGD